MKINVAGGAVDTYKLAAHTRRADNRIDKIFIGREQKEREKLDILCMHAVVVGELTKSSVLASDSTRDVADA